MFEKQREFVWRTEMFRTVQKCLLPQLEPVRPITYSWVFYSDVPPTAYHLLLLIAEFGSATEKSVTWESHSPGR
jgi:hypothetical protein